ncbi:type II toxin-antitoxin system death-on-curing family toxin [Enterococcus ureilyticus]|uniref:type II toxin-antitoxin system death-on-curing family toxin n=1 Tax=Enterococcus ureilyticus TaxID=1131292 RepID=UPI001F5E08F5|nr:type II toxin-antitoxin system death-on-curing family toxin [Enterococcus ureilyticus]
MKYLTIEEVIAMNYALIKRYSPCEVIGVKEMGALEMVIAQPKQEVFGEELYPTVFDKAYILYEKLIKKHCFHNGNKRTAVLALLVFLKRNGFVLEVDDSELEDMSVGIAVNEVSQEEVVSWLEKNCCRV